MLNLLLRCSTSDTIAFLLQTFQPSHPNLDDEFELTFPWETKATQPDVRLEGTHSRIFIEVKVDAGIKLDQIRKYASLHYEMDERFGPKAHYLFFLTKRDFASCWRPRSEIADFQDVHGFVERQLATQAGSAENFVGSLKCSAGTWAGFASRLETLLSSFDVARIVERRIITDFLTDLHNRALIPEKLDTK